MVGVSNLVSLASKKSTWVVVLMLVAFAYYNYTQYVIRDLRAELLTTTNACTKDLTALITKYESVLSNSKAVVKKATVKHKEEVDCINNTYNKEVLEVEKCYEDNAVYWDTVHDIVCSID